MRCRCSNSTDIPVKYILMTNKREYMAYRKFSVVTFILEAAVLLAIAVGTVIIMGRKEKTDSSYIGKAVMECGDRLTPEQMISLGRVSSPRLSGNGKHILYTVTYTSIEENRACSNIFICNADGSGNFQLTRDGRSIGNVRWCDGDTRIAFLYDGQMWSAALRKKGSGWRLGKRRQITDIAGGIREFSLSPDESMIMYVSAVKGGAESPSDIYPDLDKADAVCTDDLMYRHWDHWVKEIPHTFISRIDLRREKCVTAESSKDILPEDEAMYELPAEPFSGIEQLDWSPDGKYIAYSCKKLSGKEYAFSTDSEIYIYDTGTGNTVEIPLKGGYDTYPVWSPDGTALCWISMERDGYEADRQRLMAARIDPERLAAATANTGEGGSAGTDWLLGLTEVSDGFRYNVAGPVWDGDSCIYFNALAEGIQGIFRAVYRPCEESYDKCASTGSWKIERITGEDLWYDFDSPAGILHKNGETVLLTSWCSMDFPTELVAVHISGKEDGHTGTDTGDEGGMVTDDAVRRTPLAAGCPVISEDIAYRQLTRENTDFLSGLKTPYTEARYIKTVDGKDMLTWVIFPPDFNAAGTDDADERIPEGSAGAAAEDCGRKYPAIEICLGGPQGTLSQGWSYRWNYRLMAEQGYVVVLPNRRGTTAFGQEWTEQISGDYCGLNMSDYLCAAREMKAEPYIGKMAACGASYGGYSVYNLCGIHGDTFDAFVAHAGIFNQEHMYMTTEELWFPNWDNGGVPEEYMSEKGTDGQWPIGPAGDGETFGGIRQGGSPWSTRPAAVRHYANSPHRKVTEWHTPLLVTHGGMDFRVPADQGMAAYNAAQLMGVPSRLVIFPDENHWILRPQNALLWHREYFSWLDRWCR